MRDVRGWWQSLPTDRLRTVTTMNVSLTDELKGFVDERVQDGGYSSTSEYVRDLIRRDRDRLALRQLLLDGITSPDAGEMDDSYINSLRTDARRLAADVA